jgi:predicted nucleic acid-binding protein
MAIIVDASIAMGWLLPSQASSLTVAAENALVREIGCVPSHFGIEVARALRRQERRKLIAPEIVDEALRRLQALPLKQDMSETISFLPSLIALARSHRLRIADAAYLELALRTRLPLATRDAALAQAAERAGAALFRA